MSHATALIACCTLLISGRPVDFPHCLCPLPFFFLAVLTTDIPGDRSSGGRGVLHLSLLLPRCLLSSSGCLDTPAPPPRKQTLLISRATPNTQHTHTQSSAAIPYRGDSDISSSTPLCYVSTVPCFPIPFMFWLHPDSDTSPFILFSSPLPPLLLVYSTLLPSVRLRFPLSRSLQVGVHNETCFHSCMPTAHLYPSNHLSFGSHAPHGASKQDAWGMKNKHSRLSSPLLPSHHSFTYKDEATLCGVRK